MSGYLDRGYVESLAEFGSPVRMPASGGWILERPCSDEGDRDAMGPYPLFMCTDWSGLARDVESLRDGLVSLTVVTDPFAPVGPELVREAFSIVRPFKTHHVLDLGGSGCDAISRHHRDSARRSLRRLEIDACARPADHLDEWMEVFSVLVARHGLRGIKAPSRAAFARQLDTPGLVMFRGAIGGHAVASQLWFVTGEVAYGHLMAATPEGYASHAFYGLTWSAVEYFAGRVRWLDFGGAAGRLDLPDSRLAGFKRGWTNDTRTAWLCGRILNTKRYQALSARVSSSDYFPAYRAGELTDETPAALSSGTGAFQ